MIILDYKECETKWHMRKKNQKKCHFCSDFVGTYVSLPSLTPWIGLVPDGWQNIYTHVTLWDL